MPTTGRTATTRALAMALAIPLLSACAAGGASSSDVQTPSTELAAASTPLAPSTAPQDGLPARFPFNLVFFNPLSIFAPKPAVTPASTAPGAGTQAVTSGLVGGVAYDVNHRAGRDVRWLSQPDQRRVLRVDGGTTCVVAAGVDPADGLAWCDPGATATPAMLHPTALATDAGGDVFIADPQAHLVFMVKADSAAAVVVAGNGQPGTPVEGGPATSSPLRSPSGLAVSLTGDRLYIADSQAREVLGVDVSGVATQWSFAATRLAAVDDEEVTPTSVPGQLYVVAGPGCTPGDGTRPQQGVPVLGRNASLATPTALTIDLNGDLFLGDPGNHQVYRIVPGELGGQSSLVAVSTDDPQLMQPASLALSLDYPVNALVAVDAATSSVLEADSSPSQLTWVPVASAPKRPAAVAGRWGSLVVGDGSTGTVTDLVAPTLPGENRRRADLEPQTATPVCAAVSSPQPSSSSSPTSAPSTSPSPASSPTGSPSSAPAQDPVFTPRSSSSSNRPKVPGNAVVPDPGTHRFSGNDRVATSVDTSKQLFPKAGSVPVVVISSASSYADSAGGARYAAEKGGSLLLTPGNKLDPAVEAEVRRSLAAGGSIVVTGREDAISPSVFSALEKIAPGRTERVGGVDRYETATKLAQRLSDEMTTTATGPIYLVTGADYPDALVVVSLARRTGGLIVLSKDGVLPPVTRALLQQMDPTGARTVPVGGAAALAAASLGGDAGRTAAAAAVVGSDRYETARKVAERFVALDAAAGARTDVVGLATGTTWPDALVGSTAMGTLVGPLLLSHGDQLDPNVVKALAAIPSSRPSSTVVFGGEAAVPASVMAAFGAAARG